MTTGMSRQVGNASKACQPMGYSRDGFYQFKELSVLSKHTGSHSRRDTGRALS